MTLRFFAISYAHLLICFLIGIMPACLLYRRSVLFRGRASALLFLSIASGCGFLLWPFLIFNVAVLLKTTVPAIVYPCTAFLLLASAVCLIRITELRNSLLDLARSHKTTIVLGALILFPIAAFHIIRPLLQRGIVMGYAIGNDGAAYLGAIDGLKSTYWGVNKPGLVLSRPLMQYAMALTSAMWRQDNYLAYGVTSAIVAFLIAAAFGATYVQLNALRNRPARAWLVFATAGAIIGVTGTFQTLYYTGTLSQYYGALPIYLALTIPLVNTRPVSLFVWSFLIFAGVITMYTIGNLLVPLGVALGYLAVCGWMSRRKLGFRHYLAACIALSTGVLVAAALYRYELRFLFEWASTRVLTYPYDLLTSIVITLGLYPQYADAAGPEVQHLKWELIVLLAVAIFAAIQRPNRRAFIYLSLPVLSIAVFPLIDSRNLLLTKYRAILLPMILIAPIFTLFLANRKKGVAVIGGGMLALALIMAAGYRELRDLYLPLLFARQIYVDAPIARFREHLLARYTPGARIYCNDYTSERHTFLRALFRPYDWQPVRANSVWPEFGYDTSHHPSWIDTFHYDYFLDTDDARGPVALRAANSSSLIDGVPHLFSLYSGEIQNLEFGLEFDTADWKTDSPSPPVSHFSMAAPAPHATLFYIHPSGEAKIIHILYRLTGDKPGTLSIGPRTVAVITPTNGNDAPDVSVDCRQFCTDHVTELNISLPPSSKVTIQRVWFE